MLGELPEESIPAPSTKVTLISECGGAFVEIQGRASSSLPCSCLERLHPGSRLRPWHVSPPVMSPITAPASLPAAPQHFSASVPLNFQPLAQTLVLIRTVLSPSHSAASIYQLPARGQTLVEATLPRLMHLIITVSLCVLRTPYSSFHAQLDISLPDSSGGPPLRPEACLPPASLPPSHCSPYLFPL